MVYGINEGKIDLFINYCAKNRPLTTKKVKSMVWGIDVVGLLALVYGVIMGGTAQIISFFAGAIMLGSTVAVLITPGKDTIENYNQAISLVCLPGAMNMSLFALICCVAAGTNLYIKLLIILLPLFASASIAGVVILRINKGKYADRKVIGRSNVQLFAIIGSVCGFFIVRTMFLGLSQMTALVVIVIVFMLCSVINCFAITNLLRLYFIRRQKKLV